MIKLRALGTGEIHTPVTTITPSHSRVFAASLYLLLERGKPVARNHLANLLWPDARESARSHRLRQTLLQMRKLGVTADADKNKVAISQSSVSTDLDDLNDQGAPLGAPLEMLAGYHPQFSQEFADWLDSKRRSVHARITRFLIAALAQAKRRADWASVDELVSQCLTLDPLNETAILARAEASAMRGAKREALLVLDDFLSELGSTPKDIRLPAEILRRRIVDRLPESPNRANEQLAFVGREAEAELLNRTLSQVRAGAGRIVQVVGEPGVGKSRLASEFGRFALLQGGEVLHTACRPSDIDRPLSLFVDLVPRLRELPGALGCEPATLAFLKRLTDLAPISTDYTGPADSQALFGSVRAALFDLLDSVVDEQFIVILVDDLQWLDEASARLVAQIVEWAASKPILFVLTSRPKTDRFVSVFAPTTMLTISLSPLGRLESDSLLRSISQQAGCEVDAEFEEWCLSVAEGNPFFLQELARHWIETGNKHAAPSSVIKVLEARTARLSRDAIRVLQTSAILSELATLERVRSVLGLQPHQLVAAVEELSATAMLRSAGEALAASESEIQPRHELVSAVAIGQLSQLSLSFLHRRSADVLEAEITDDNKRASLWWACAKHSLLAGDKVRALSYSVACAEHLLAMGLGKEAAEAFGKSLEYCTSDEQRLKILPRVAFSLQTDEKWELSIEVLKKCIRLRERIGPSEGHNEFELLLLEARYHSSFDYGQLFEAFKSCVICPEASPPHRVRAGIHALKLATDIGPRESIDSLYESLAPVIQSDDVPRQDALELGIVYRSLASDDLIPTDDFREFLAAGKPDILEYFYRIMTVVSSCRATGRYEDGLAFVREALVFATSLNLRTYVAQAHLAEVHLHLAAENYQAADCAFQQIRDRLSETQNLRLQEDPFYMDARIALETGDVERCKIALSKIASVSPYYSRSRTTYYFALHVGLRILLHSPSDKLAPHVARLKEAHWHSQSLSLQDFETYWLFRGLVAVGKKSEAGEMLRTYVEVHRQCRWPLNARLRKLLEPGKSARVAITRLERRSHACRD